MTKQPKWMTQPRYYNSGQPSGYEPVQCSSCFGTGTAGGSKCSRCQGHSRVFQQIDKPDHDYEPDPDSRNRPGRGPSCRVCGLPVHS